MDHFAFAACVVAVAGMVRGATGFGFALISAIALSQVMPVALVTPMLMLIEVGLTATILLDGGAAALNLRRAAPLFAGGAFGVALGVALFTALSGPTSKIVLDAVILVSAALALVHVRLPWLDRTWIAVIVGLLTGAAVGAFAVGGPIAVVWLLAIGAPPPYMRATLTVFFSGVDLLSIAGRLGTGTFPREALIGALWLAPIGAAGTLLGGMIFRRLNPTHWRIGIAAFIAVAALLSLGRSLLVG
jgi:uncharacterized membrane protein YfcA